jgi:hypothetical protein
MTNSTKTMPSHKMYRVIKGRTEQDKDIWTEIAALWEHKDRGGFSIKFKPNEGCVAGSEYVIRRNKPQARPAAQPV